MLSIPCSVPSNSERCVARTFAGRRLLLDREAVVLARDHHAPGVDLDDRMVCAVVAELHLHGLRAAREPEQLVAETDAERRHAAIDDLCRSPRSRSRTAPDRRDRSRGTRRPGAAT